MRRTRVSLALCFFLYFGAGGIVMPILSLILADHGMSGAMIGMLSAVFPAAVLIVGPGATLMVDRGRPTRRLLVYLSLFALAGVVAAGLSASLSALIAGVVLFAIARAPLAPLLDALTLRILSTQSDRYGSIRLWGSFGFLLGAWGLGKTVDAGAYLPFLAAAVSLSLFALVAASLPGEPAATGNARSVSLRPALVHWIIWPLLVLGFAQGLADGIYDIAFSLHVVRLGHPVSVATDAVAVGVAAELTMIAVAPILLRWVGPMPLVIAGLIAGVARWAGIGLIDEPGLLTALQGLHGLTFAAFWCGAVSIIGRHAPLHAVGSCQGLFTAAMGGLGPLAASAIAALLLDRLYTSTLFLSLAVLTLATTTYALIRLYPAVRRVAPVI